MDTVLSLVVLAAIVLVGAAIFAFRRGARQQALLMLVLAAVGVANVLIWTVPDAAGTSPAEKLDTAKSEGASR